MLSRKGDFHMDRSRYLNICLSFSASLSTLLLAAGTKGKRYAFSKALITPTLHTTAKTEAIYSPSAEIAHSITEKTIEVFSNLTQIDYLAMKAACLTEHFLSANEAQSKGFIDSVISDKCYSIKMMQITKRYKILKTLEGIWYDNIIKKLKSIGIIK
jgi:ATP-dependent Clp protease protease subunit